MLHIRILTQKGATLSRYKAKLKEWGITFEVADAPAFKWNNGTVDKEWIAAFCDKLRRFHRSDIDVIQFFIKRDNWRAKRSVRGLPVVGHHYTKEYSGKRVCAVKIRPGDDKTAEHELMHAIKAIIFVQLGIRLEGVFGVEDFDEDVVHGGDPRFREGQYDEVFAQIRPLLEAAIAIRRGEVTPGLIDRLRIFKRQLMLKQSEEFTERAFIGAPLDASFMANVTQEFGVRNTRYPRTLHHTGRDIGAPVGTPIYAVTECRITKVFEDHPILGNACEFEFTLNGEFYTGRFLHMQFPVKIGAYRKGDFIGRVGLTGDTDGPHLHWDIVRGTYDLTGINEHNFRDKFVDPSAIMRM